MTNGRTKNKTIDYDKVAKVYDQVRAGDPEMVQKILQGIDCSSGSMVLDIGCGTANNTLLFASSVPSRVIGLDISFGMLKKARRKSEQIGLVQGPAGSLPFAGETFQFAFMTDVLHHLPDISQAIKEIHRVLRSGGSLCVVTQSHKQIDSRMTSRFFPASASVDKERYPDVDVVEACLLNSGFADVDPKAYNFAPTKLGNNYLETATKRGYSMLHKISNEEYERGLADLKAAFARGEELIYSAGYTFIWAIRN
jgi:ubiquinone/menaquinone biosynthesis C-methylase UbiE